MYQYLSPCTYKKILLDNDNISGPTRKTDERIGQEEKSKKMRQNPLCNLCLMGHTCLIQQYAVKICAKATPT